MATHLRIQIPKLLFCFPEPLLWTSSLLIQDCNPFSENTVYNQASGLRELNKSKACKELPLEVAFIKMLKTLRLYELVVTVPASGANKINPKAMLAKLWK